MFLIVSRKKIESNIYNETIKFIYEEESCFKELFKYSYKVKVTNKYNNIDDISTPNIKTYQDLLKEYLIYYQKNDFLQYEKQLLERNLDTYFKLNQRKINFSKIIRYSNINTNFIIDNFWNKNVKYNLNDKTRVYFYIKKDQKLDDFEKIDYDDICAKKNYIKKNTFFIQIEDDNVDSENEEKFKNFIANINSLKNIINNNTSLKNISCCKLTESNFIINFFNSRLPDTTESKN
ncbi:hypothetical protein GVAV_001071 [Gurleya vavrai]